MSSPLTDIYALAIIRKGTTKDSECMKHLPFAATFFTLIGAFALNPSGASAKGTRCSPNPTPEALISSWAAKTVAHMKGRTNVRVLMNQTKQDIRVPIHGEDVDLTALPLKKKDIETAEKLASRLNKIISIDLVAESSAEKADLFVTAVCEPEHKSDYGIVTSDKSGKKLIMLINTCSDVYRNYKGSFGPIFLHELGHVLGLEHPFDDSDGDCMISTERFSAKSAHMGQTLMAYREDPNDGPLDFYTATDIQALLKIWGPNR